MLELGCTGGDTINIKPLMKVAALIFAVVYFIWPVDILPDVIPLVGYLDDIVVGLAAIWYFFKGR